MIQNVKTTLEKVLSDRKKSMYALAKETDIAYSTVHKLTKKEVQSIDLTVLKKICENLDCTPNDVIPINH